MYPLLHIVPDFNIGGFPVVPGGWKAVYFFHPSTEAVVIGDFRLFGVTLLPLCLEQILDIISGPPSACP